MILTGLAVGALLGIVMQRGRFCVTGMLRDIFLQKTWRTTVALFIVIAVHAVGIAALTSFGIITPRETAFAPIAVIVGGFVFGLGIILAGGCASGTWFRSAEGLIGSWFALVFYGLSAAAMNTGALSWLNNGLSSYETSLTTLPTSFGVSAWFFAIPLAIGTALAARHYLATEKQPAKLSVPFWKRPLHLYTAGALVGLIGVIAWPLSAAAGRNSGLGITTPSANLMNFFTTGDVERIDWGVMLVLGLFIGAFAAAKATGEFRLRVPDATTATRAVVGGTMMGVGAALAGGCTVGNGMVQTALFSYQGWIALLFIALGVGAGAKIWLKPAAAPTTEETYSTEESIESPSSAEDHVLATSPSFQVATGAVALKTAPRVKKARPIAEGRYALDQMGAVCPFPLIETKDVLNTLESGEELVIDFDCTQGTETIPQWAANNGHDVTDFHATGDASWQITIKKG
ncbi:MAG: YeeE/YedE thiosulfate transporter family protein [Corynebacterium sp.]|uniref:YeeE/YedE thiosulfate transporter family protein n=1 Tax=Corynebacterium sp. TaxID=1720 RepID=UPI0026E011F1|nr:YeeE/YedE thiosulfate transporter family protein [Corynebacterium sp.]MDO5668709.1 YeeE/YedE thiosulfate transporter family protein [Corynebacterium sp.]